MTDLHSSWRSTSDDTALPDSKPESQHAELMESRDASSRIVAVKQANEEGKNDGQNTKPISTNIRVDPSVHGSMKFAALTGILLVTMSVVTFYFGVDFLRASLTGKVQQVDVTVTADGQFDPEEITLVPGDTLVITNRNADPQVIKSKNQAELFPVQILETDQSYGFDVPLSAENGAYIYLSETLPLDRELRITVHADASQDSQVAESASSNDILIPMLRDMQSSSMSSVSSASSPEFQPSAVDQNSLSRSSVQTNPFAGSANIQTNPYTVGNKQFSGTTSTLHGGAPRNPKKPKTSPETGPELWLAGLCAIAAVLFMYGGQRKYLNK